MVETTNSFPSGHSTGSMIFFLDRSRCCSRIAGRGGAGRRPRRSRVAMLVGMTRVMLGVHWPSDVVGGWAFGALWVILTLRMAEDLIERRVRR